MSREEFAGVVDQEVRGRAPRDLAQALRSPEVADRWYQQLVTMKKSAEAQLAAKSADDKEQRITLTLVAREFPEKSKEMLRRADEVRAQYLKWRAGVLRFRSGVEERLAEASWRRRMSTSLIPSALIDERNQLLSQVSALTAAIKAHKASMADLEEADEADEALWRTIAGCGGRIRLGDEAKEE